MSRKKKTKRAQEPDHIYNDLTVAKFINQIMRRGKKTAARKIVYGALEIVKEKTKKDSLEIFKQAIKNVTPALEVRPRRVGGATYQVPRQVSADRGLTLAMRWIIKAAKPKKGKPMKEKLAEELMLASRNEGGAAKKKYDTHRMAEANRAFAHFAW